MDKGRGHDQNVKDLMRVELEGEEEMFLTASFIIKHLCLIKEKEKDLF